VRRLRGELVRPALGVDIGFGQAHWRRAARVPDRLRWLSGPGWTTRRGRRLLHGAAGKRGLSCRAHERTKWFGADHRSQVTQISARDAEAYPDAAATASLGRGNPRCTGPGGPGVRRVRVPRMADGRAACELRVLGRGSDCPFPGAARIRSLYAQWDGRGWPGELPGGRRAVRRGSRRLVEEVRIAHGSRDQREVTDWPRGGPRHPVVRRSGPASAATRDVSGDLDTGQTGTRSSGEPALGYQAGRGADRAGAARRGQRSGLKGRPPRSAHNPPRSGRIRRRGGRQWDGPNATSRPCAGRPVPAWAPGGVSKLDLGQDGGLWCGRNGERVACFHTNRADAAPEASAGAARRDRGAARERMDG